MIILVTKEVTKEASESIRKLHKITVEDERFTDAVIFYMNRKMDVYLSANNEIQLNKIYEEIVSETAQQGAEVDKIFSLIITIIIFYYLNKDNMYKEATFKDFASMKTIFDFVSKILE